MTVRIVGLGGSLFAAAAITLPDAARAEAKLQPISDAELRGASSS
jgi:hypothetical protein